MDFLDDLRDPRTLIGKVFMTFAVLLLLSLLAALAISGFLVHGVLWPARTSAGVDISAMLNPPEEVPVAVPGGASFQGWLFPGLRTAPVIILCHGYGGQRSDLLTLTTPFREHQYNVFVFDLPGHGATEGRTSLGPDAAVALRSAIEELSRRNDLDGSRFGVWGMDLGGYAAFVAATSEPRVKAIAVDSVYEEPRQFLDLQVQRSGLGSVPLVGTFTRLGYGLFNWSSRNEASLSSRVGAIGQIGKLFIQGRENPALADTTLQLFLKAPEPRAQAVFQRTAYPTLPDSEKREYERQVINFFLEHLPVATTPARR